VLIGLDLSAAFDTVDHEILLEHLQTEFGVEGMPLTSLQSYRDGRTQYVKIGQHQSTAIELQVGVPRGSVLGPILFAVTPVLQLLASLQATVFGTTSMLTTMQLRLAMCADYTTAGLSVLAGCTTCRTACSSTWSNQKH